jgi:hypothetical protein
MEVGPTGEWWAGDPVDARYASRFDGREIVRRCLEARCEYLVIWARDGAYAYYDSKLQPKCPGLGRRDVLREAVAGAAPRNLPVIAYCVVQDGGYPLRARPDFAARGADGKPAPRYCLNSGYLEYMKQLLSEIAAYGVAGFHVDMLDQGFGPPVGCWCERCAARFRAEYGRAMPRGVTWDEDWDRMLEFRYRTSQRFEQALRGHLRAVNPRITVDFNYHGNPPFSWEVGQRPVQHAGNADFVTGETGVWGFSALTVGLNAEFYQAATPGRPFQVAMQRGARMYHDQTTRPLNDLRWELFTLRAHGAQVTIVDKAAYDGRLDPVAYQRIGAAFAEARAKRAEFGHRPVAEVGLYFSSRTRDWQGRETPDRYFQNFYGAQRALVYEHIPWGVLLDENLTLERLKQYSVVMLPNVAILSPREIDLLRRYTEDGGRLLVTGASGTLGPRGEPLAETALAGLIGGKLAGRLESLDNWVRLGGVSPRATALRGDIPADWSFLVHGPAVIYRPTTAEAVGELLRPQRPLGQPERAVLWIPLSAGQPAGPAVLVRKLGKGTVLSIAASPDAATASEYQVAEARRLLAHAVRMLDPSPVIEISAPAHVEAVVTDDPAARVLRVHLLAYLSPPATMPPQNRPYVLPSLIEDLPLYQATIRVRRPVRGVRAWNTSTVLDTRDAQRPAGRIQATVNDVHEVIAVEYGE